jgi:hypothetical protein
MQTKSTKTLVVCALAAVLYGCGMPEAEVMTDPLAGEQVAPDDLAATGQDLKLSGAHYNLNIIGVPKSKSADMTNNDGRRIFVALNGKTTINLAEGPFQVLDANGTDGVAQFQLPNPDADGDGTTSYSVYARALGKPGGKSTTTTCFTDATGETYCSVYSMVLVREKGRTSFTNVSQELLYVYVDTDGDGKLERYSLFSDSLADYFWSYDNQGLRLAQLRFYEIATTVAAP